MVCLPCCTPKNTKTRKKAAQILPLECHRVSKRTHTYYALHQRSPPGRFSLLSPWPKTRPFSSSSRPPREGQLVTQKGRVAGWGVHEGGGQVWQQISFKLNNKLIKTHIFLKHLHIIVVNVGLEKPHGTANFWALFIFIFLLEYAFLVGGATGPKPWILWCVPQAWGRLGREGGGEGGGSAGRGGMRVKSRCAGTIFPFFFLSGGNGEHHEPPFYLPPPPGRLARAGQDCR